MTLVDRRTPGWFPVFLREFGCDVIRRGARLQASSVINIRRRRKQPESELSIWKSEASRERASEGAAGVGKGGGGWEGWEKKESSPFLPAPRCRVSSHVPLVRVLFTISPNGKLAFMLGRMLAQPC